MKVSGVVVKVLARLRQIEKSYKGYDEEFMFQSINSP
jgi:hypothetical protein